MLTKHNKKVLLLTLITLIIGVLYLLLGIDFEIFDYQIQSRLRKFILIILVGGAIGTSVVIFKLLRQIGY